MKESTLEIATLAEENLSENEILTIATEFTNGVHSPDILRSIYDARGLIIRIIFYNIGRWDTVDRIERALKQGRLLGLYKDGELAAVGGYETLGKMPDGRAVHMIELVVVKEKFRGNRYSKLISDMVIDKIKEKHPKDAIGRLTKDERILKNIGEQGFSEIPLINICRYLCVDKEVGSPEDLMTWFDEKKEEGEIWKAYIYDPLK